MILQALYQYCEQMRATIGTEEIAPPGMEWKKISFIIRIDRRGTFIDLETRDARFLVPKDNARTSKVEAQLLWDHCGYVLGLPRERGNEKDETNCPKQFEAFKEKVYSLPDIDEFKAVKQFYEREEYLNVREHPLIGKIFESKGGRISFIIDGHDSNSIVATAQATREYVHPKNRANGLERGTAVCLVTGERNQQIALTHEKITIGRDNAPLLGCQKDSGFDSYGKEQGMNAPISFVASDAIGSALKYLLGKDKESNYCLGATTFVFWSSTCDSELLKAYKTATFEGDKNSQKEEEEEEAPPSPKTSGKRGKQKKTSPSTPSDNSYKVLQAFKATKGEKGARIRAIDHDRFYILGLAPNSGRISIKLWLEGNLSEIIDNTLRHLNDMNIISSKGNLNSEVPPMRSLYQIVLTVSSTDKPDKWSANLIQSIVESIVAKRPYPQTLQQACLDRLRHAQPITELRAAILKAYINRKHQKEILSMALDPTQTNKAYLAGRLFALLENIQRCALGDIKRTIRDSYYGAASTTPRTVFGRLDALSKAHLSKLRKEHPGRALYRERLLGEIYGLFPGSAPEFPTHFTLDDQSIFAVGYYHQRVDLWTKRSTKEDDCVINEIDEQE